MAISELQNRINGNNNKTDKFLFLGLATFGWMVVFILIILTAFSIFNQKNIKRDLTQYWTSMANLIAFKLSQHGHIEAIDAEYVNAMIRRLFENNKGLIRGQLLTNNKALEDFDNTLGKQEESYGTIINRALLGMPSNGILTDNSTTVLRLAEPIFINGKPAGAIVLDIDYDLSGRKTLGNARLLFSLTLALLTPWLAVLMLIYRKTQKDILEHNQYLEATNLIWMKIVNTVESDKILDVTLSEILHILDMEAGWIYLKDPNTRKMYLAAKKGNTTNISPSINTMSLEAPTPADQAEVDMNLNKLINDKYQYSQKFRLGEEIPYAYLDIPLNIKDHLMGILSVAGRRRKPLSPGEQEFVLSLCQQVAMAIENAQLFSNLSKQAVELSFLLHTAMISASSFNLSDVLAELSREIVETLKVAFCKIFLFDDEKQVLTIQAQYPQTSATVENGSEFSLDEMPAHKLTLLSKQPQMLDKHNLEDFAGVKEHKFIFGPKTTAVLMVPLRVSSNVLGCLTIGESRREKIRPEDINLSTTMASQISLSIGNAKLYYNLEQAYTELKKTQNKLIQTERLKALGVMASGIAHEFNNILSIISGRVEILDRANLEITASKQLLPIKQAIDDGSTIIKRIREFSRIGHSYNFQVIETSNIVKDVISMAENLPQTRKKGKGEIKIVAVLEESGQILADPVEIREVLINMIINAIDAMPESGTITLETKIEENNSLIIIKDDGVGMDEATAARVFEPFFTTKGESGSGLGLAVAYGIISSHDGTIDISSQPGKGTVFTIKMPLIDPSQTAIYDIKSAKKYKTDQLFTGSKR